MQSDQGGDGGVLSHVGGEDVVAEQATDKCERHGPVAGDQTGEGVFVPLPGRANQLGVRASARVGRGHAS